MVEPSMHSQIITTCSTTAAENGDSHFLNSINAVSIDQLRIIRAARSQFHHHVNYDDVCLLETLEPSSIFIAAASIEPWCLKQSWHR